MANILRDIQQTLRKGLGENFLANRKPFAGGMYRFSMFMISYYSRVRDQLKLDYDSFMIIQTVVGHTLYHLNKSKNSPSSYEELETEWEKAKNSIDNILNVLNDYQNMNSSHKLTYSSICLVTKLPKETVRRKTNQLIKRELLKLSKDEGIILGPQYKKVFSNFVPQTVADISKLVQDWEKNGVLKNILNFRF